MLKVLKCVPFDIAAAAEAVAIVGLVAMAAASVSVATMSAPAVPRSAVPRAATTGVAALVATVAVVTMAVAVVIATTVASVPAVPGASSGCCIDSISVSKESSYLEGAKHKWIYHDAW